MNPNQKQKLLTIFIFLGLGLIVNEAVAQRGGAKHSNNKNRAMPSKKTMSSRPSTSHSPSMHRPTSTRPSSKRKTTQLPASRPSVNFPNKTQPNNKFPTNPRPSTGGNKIRPQTNRPTTKPAGGASNSRPTPSQINQFMDFRGPSNRPAQRPQGGAAGNFLKDRPSTLPANPINKPAVQPTPRPIPQPGTRPTTRPATKPGTKIPPANRVRPVHYPVKIKPVTRPAGYRPPGSRPVGYRPPGYRPPRPVHLPAYGPGYWGRYPHYRYHWNRYNKNWWAYAIAGAITSWWANGINRQPVYYDYGTNIYYEGDQVYYQGNPVGTPEEYSQQAQSIAESAPEVDPDNVEWLPLGVFAITENEGSVENATLYLQLAISKEGLIGGTFQNTLTDDSFEVEGTVDKESQRAAWGPVGKQWPIMETGLYNLTENEAGALIHFDNGQTQQWTMTRIDDQQIGKN
jgi:hypothetical protein